MTVRGCGRKEGQKSIWGQITGGLESPAKEFGRHSIAFEGYSIKGSWEGKPFALISDFSDTVVEL